MAQSEAEFRDLPLRHFGGQDRLRSVEGAAPLVQFDWHVWKTGRLVRQASTSLS